jgi:carbamate kinase
LTGKESNTSQSSKRIVIALGGNAILKAHQIGIVEEQLENIRITWKQKRLIPQSQRCQWMYAGL